MYCNNCGTQVPDSSKFCHNCGHKLHDYNASEQKQDFQSAPNTENQSTENQSAENTQNQSDNNQNEQSTQADEQQNTQSENQQTQDSWASFEIHDKQPKNNDSMNLALKILSGVFAVIFALNGLSAILTSLLHLDAYGYILRFNPLFIFTLPLSIVSGIVYIIAALVLVAFGFKRSKENSAGLFLALCASCVLIIIMLVLRQLFNLAVFGSIATNTFLQFILPVICVGGAYALLHAASETPDFAGFASNAGSKLMNAILSVKDALCKLISDITKPNNNNAQYGGNAQNTGTNTQYNGNTQYTGTNAQYNGNTQYGAGQQYNNVPHYNQPYNVASTPLRQDRNIFVFIILNLITCGIYGLYTVYSLANDVNKACEGDGQTTSGLIMFILLSIITCGIYSFYWYYAIANRIFSNAPRYGMSFEENGTTVLLWMLLGSLLCGIGYWVAYHIIFKNMNAIAAAYNNRKF